MKPRLIQTEKIADNNKAEKEMLRFLTELPEGYTIYRELQINRAYEERVRGMEKGQPDFVVVGNEIGLLSIEVKDWNLTLSEYSWRDQYKVVKKDTNTGKEIALDNPAAQADNYRYAFIELMGHTGVWVTSIVAFPRLSRQAFLNKIANIDVLQNPQSKFFLNLATVIFKEDLDDFLINPDDLLKRIVRTHSGFRPATPAQTNAVNERLLPNAFRIGDINKRRQARDQLQMITVQQEKWIFDLEREASYLLDVAGSGKTNVLVSRAIHVIDTAYKNKQTPPNILLTTYNPNLQRNIERILEGKINAEERQTRYATLRIENVEHIMRRIATTGYGCKTLHEYHRFNDPKKSGYAKALRDDVKAALQDNPDRYRIFDYVFIDEIQDFDDDQLFLVRQLARTNNFFFVGDIGQKIYDRYHDLLRHNFVIDTLDLPKSYKMYRTPRYIGELAFRFVMADSILKSEFEEHGYRQDTQFASYNNNAAEFHRVDNPIHAIVERLQDLLNGQWREDDLMVITHKPLLQKFKMMLDDAGILAGIGQPKQSGQVSLVDFMNVKGLEREVVFITGIENLPHRNNSLFVDLASQLKEERFSRRKIYVALTRSIDECIVIYTDPGNMFVNELLTINRTIMSKRQSVKP